MTEPTKRRAVLFPPAVQDVLDKCNLKAHAAVYEGTGTALEIEGTQADATRALLSILGMVGQLAPDPGAPRLTLVHSMPSNLPKVGA